MCLNTTSEDHVKCSKQDFDHQTLSCTNSIQTFEEIAVCPELHNNLSSAAAAAAHLHFLLLLHNF
jgi:hypothetical protein